MPVGDTAMIIHTTTLLLLWLTVVLLTLLWVMGMWALMAEAACGFSWGQITQTLGKGSRGVRGANTCRPPGIFVVFRPSTTPYFSDDTISYLTPLTPLTQTLTS